MKLKNIFKKKPKEYPYFRSKEIEENPQQTHPYGEKPKGRVFIESIIKLCKKEGKYECVAMGEGLKKELNKEGLLD